MMVQDDRGGIIAPGYADPKRRRCGVDVFARKRRACAEFRIEATNTLQSLATE
jgi:hypothetical protein